MSKQITIFPLFFLIIATTFQYGFFSLPGLLLICTAFIFLLFIFFQKKLLTLAIDKNTEILFFTFIIVYILFMFFSGGIYQERAGASLALTLIPIAIFTLILTYGFKIRQIESIIRYRYIIILFFALFLRVLMLIASPAPKIDTFFILKEAPQALLSGFSPYAIRYSKVYQNVEPDYYSYWPASFLLEVPFVTLFSDPRMLFVFADIGAALLLYLLGKKTRPAELLSLIYLFRPNSLFIIEQSWLTPLAFFFIVLSFYLVSRMKVNAAAIVWGLLVGLKPDYVLAIPFFWFLTRFDKKALLIFLITLAIIVLPFFLLDPNKFITQTLLLYLLPFDKIPIPIHLSLNLNTLYYQFFASDLPIFVPSILFATLFFTVFYLLYKRYQVSKETKDVENNIILGMTIIFFGVYLLFRQAFINYYYFITGLYIMWMVIKIKNRIS